MRPHLFDHILNEFQIFLQSVADFGDSGFFHHLFVQETFVQLVQPSLPYRLVAHRNNINRAGKFRVNMTEVRKPDRKILWNWRYFFGGHFGESFECNLVGTLKLYRRWFRIFHLANILIHPYTHNGKKVRNVLIFYPLLTIWHSGTMCLEWLPIDSTLRT